MHWLTDWVDNRVGDNELREHVAVSANGSFRVWVNILQSRQAVYICEWVGHTVPVLLDRCIWA